MLITYEPKAVHTEPIGDCGRVSYQYGRVTQRMVKRNGLQGHFIGCWMFKKAKLLLARVRKDELMGVRGWSPVKDDRSPYYSYSN